MGVAAAKKFDMSVIVLVGSLEPGVEKVLDKGIDVYFSIVPGIVTLEAAIDRASVLLADYR